MIKFYAVFTRKEGTVEVEFPDIDGCYAYGFDLTDAYNMAFDKLYYCLPNVKQERVDNPSSYEDLRARFPSENQVILPFLVDSKYCQAS